MFSRIAVVALGLLAAAEGTVVINQENGDVPANSEAGRNLMHHARELSSNYYGQNYNNNGQNNNGQNNNNAQDNANADYSFLSAYSVKFQGCHHIQQWNDGADSEDDVRIMTKRLVRFRLCPSGECSTELGGCSSKYGDYVVDMETYLSSFYSGNGGRDLAYDASSYTTCTQFDMRRHLENNNNANAYYGQDDVTYYIGPYCADQGGEIHVGLFTDDTCTSFAKSQYAIQGLPYTQNSMVTMSCTSCGYQSSFCSAIYAIAGKCETKMSVYYPNEAACTYIEGIKIIREDGVIRSSSTQKSKPAAIATGCFLSVSVLLAGYVYYLRTKLSRAKINLNASSAPLA